MIDPCCCQWGCNCRMENGKCKVCAKKALLSGQAAESKEGQVENKSRE